MKTYQKLKKDYEELLERYAQLSGEHMELDYQYRMLLQKSGQEMKQNQEIYQIHENARKLKHDMKNHVMVVASYLQEQKTEEAKRYLSEMLDKLNRMYTYVETGNSLLNHILNRKLEEAQKQGIRIKAQIENLSFARMESMDFSAVLTNLLDNAIEAKCEEDPVLEVEIVRKRGYDCIGVKNRVGSRVLLENPELRTTKENGTQHGFGILQVREIVEKYEGMVEFFEEDGMFLVWVMIPS